MPEIAIQPGTKIQRLTYVEDAGYSTSSTGRSRFRMGLFECECGERVVVSIRHWKAGASKSCGCARFQPRTHGQSGTPIHESWKAMRSRTSPRFWKIRPTYTGVKCDPRWQTFEGFLANQPTTGRPHARGLHLARFNDTGDYTPENTRWLTKQENSAERRQHRNRVPPHQPAALAIDAQS